MQMNLDLSQSFQILERKMRLVGIFVRFEKSKVILLCFYCWGILLIGCSWKPTRHYNTALFQEIIILNELTFK